MFPEQQKVLNEQLNDHTVALAIHRCDPKVGLKQLRPFLVIREDGLNHWRPGRDLKGTTSPEPAIGLNCYLYRFPRSFTKTHLWTQHKSRHQRK